MEPTVLDLSRERTLGELILTTVALFVRYSGLFLSATLLVVAPVVVLVDGVWGHALRDGSVAHQSPGVATASVGLAFLMPVLVTALHATIVRRMGEGQVPGVGEALRTAAPRLPAALAAVALYTAGVVAGCLLLVIPGVWFLVRGYFAAQAAVLDGANPLRAIEASVELVGGRFWRVAGILLVGGVLSSLLGAVAGRAVPEVHDGVLFVSLTAVLQAVTLSLTALFGTLLFFSLRADRAALAPAA